MTVAVLLLDRVLDDDIVADVLVMLLADHPKVEWAREHGITVAPGARLTGGTEREVVMNALGDADCEVIAVIAHTALGDDDRVTIYQWVYA